MSTQADGPLVFVDFETRSEADLTRVGGRNYVAHASTALLCAVAIVVEPGAAASRPGVDDAALRVGAQARVYCWAPWKGPTVLAPVGLPPPSPWARRIRPPALATQPRWEPPLWESDDPPAGVLDALDRGGRLVAHNAQGFDRHVWAALGLGLPERPWLDSLDRARRAALPGKLEDLGQRLYARGKDAAGRKLMMQHATPQRPRREDRYGGFRDPAPPALGAIVRYCALDVLLLAAVWHDFGLGEPHPDDPVLEVHERINARGVAIDLDYLARLQEAERRVTGRALELASSATGAGNLRDLVSSPQQLTAWLAERGVEVEDVKAETLERVQTSDPTVRAVLDARLAEANVVRGKLDALAQLTGPDGRYRDWSAYYGAHTGRWSGRGAQMQNFPRASE